MPSSPADRPVHRVRSDADARLCSWHAPRSLFGFLIVATELKSWPIIGAFQKRVDKYFHLLSIAKGKGAFYCFIGFLAFVASEWSLARVCTLLVCIVGVFHLLGYPREPDQQQGLAASDDAQHQTDGMEAAAMSGVTEFAMKVISHTPLDAAVTAPPAKPICGAAI